MKYLLIIGFMLLCICHKMEARAVSFPEDSIYTQVDSEPVPPGGYAGFSKFLAEHFMISKQDIDSGFYGTMRLKLVIMSDGTCVLKETKPAMMYNRMEAIIKTMPGWKPAEVGGKPVNCLYIVPLHLCPLR